MVYKTKIKKKKRLDFYSYPTLEREKELNKLKSENIRGINLWEAVRYEQLEGSGGTINQIRKMLYSMDKKELKEEKEIIKLHNKTAFW